MYTDEDLDSAVAAGVLSAETAGAFRAHVAGLANQTPVDEEHFRLITGFNDVFVVIACMLLLASVAWIGGTVVPVLGPLSVAAAAWFLGEYFTRMRRMALPSIFLLLCFVGGIFAVGAIVFGRSAQGYLVASAIAAMAAWFHWRRFQVPITVAAGAAAVVGFAVALLLSALPDGMDWKSPVLFIAGVCVFVLAMRWDASDTARRTRRSDVAFWLHLLAAPLLVHPVFAALGVFEGRASPWQAVAVIVLYVAIALTSLCVDRRALMVSALLYVLVTFSSLLKQFGVVGLSFAITALIIGSALLLLSAFWHPSRAAVLRHLPPAMRQRLALSS